MNAAARQVGRYNVLFGEAFSWQALRYPLHSMLLLLLLLCSAVTVVYVKNDARELFSELQYAQGETEKLNLAWGELMLEESTWATPARVQAIAEKRFAMQTPSSERTVMVTL